MAFKREEPKKEEVKKEEVKKPEPQPQGNEILIDTSNDPKAG